MVLTIPADVSTASRSRQCLPAVARARSADVAAGGSHLSALERALMRWGPLVRDNLGVEDGGRGGVEA